MKQAVCAARDALLAHWRLKVGLSATLTLFFCLIYFTLQRVTYFPIRQLPPSPVDRAIPFMADWVWAYQSVYLLLTAVPWLVDREEALRRYARGFLVLSSIGFACFLVVPLEVPRPLTAANPMFRLLVSYDAPVNTLPSLHVGLAVYTVLFGVAYWQPRLIRGAWLLVLGTTGVWTIAIAFSALAIKQHYLADLAAGAALAYVVHRCVREPSLFRSAHADSVPSRRSSDHVVACDCDLGAPAATSLPGPADR
jgi:membrane-associated phospholipid phosphatase